MQLLNKNDNIKSKTEIEKMREAGKILAETFELLKKNIKPGITTNELDKLAEKYIRSKGAIPSFLNYNGFPKSICVSVNEQVIHGIPDNTVLNDGDIVSIDIGVLFKGFHGDSAKTFPVGEISPEAKRLIEVTRSSFYEGLKFAKEGFRISDISKAIEKVALNSGYSVVKDFVGHGIGANLHEEPEVPNYFGSKPGPRLYKGMTIAIEPMIIDGGCEVEVLSNDWTVVSKDKGLSAHYEHTVLITSDEPQILTRI